MKMANMKALIVLSVLCLVTGDKIMPGPDVTSSTDNGVPSTTTTTTSKPTQSPLTTTTSVPPTTTKPTTPTTTTTSTTSTTTTTTIKPNTTTTAPTTTTMKPTTTPPPLVPGKWMANYTGTNNTCLILEAALQIDLAYGVNKTYSMVVPSKSKAEGICNVKTENITIRFGEANSITFDFVKSSDNKKYDVEMIVVTLSAIPGTNATSFVLVNQTKEYSTPLSNSYKCKPERILEFAALDKALNYTGKLHISHLQVQAFMNSTNHKFDEALDCQGSETPDVVPIAVGLALVTLVIIVLIAYLIGRRRSQARGYLSM